MLLGIEDYRRLAGEGRSLLETLSSPGLTDAGQLARGHGSVRTRLIAGGGRDSPLRSRDPKHDVHLTGRKACHGATGIAVRTLNFETGASRPSNLGDVRDLTRPADRMDYTPRPSRNAVATDMLKGIHAALVTPFDKDLKVDTEALRRNVEYQIGAGIAGLCPLGGTGEPLSQTLDEHRLVIDTVMEAANGRVPVTVGCLRGGQAEVIEMARHARSAGAQRMMVVPPYFYGARFHDIRRHYMEVAAAVDLPVVLFHSPGRSGIRLSADELLTIFHEVPAVSAMKEASGDAILAADVMAGAPEGFAFLQGLDELLLQTLALGASGAIVSLAELLPRSLTRLFELVRRGDLATAQEIQIGIMPLCRLLYGEPNPGPLKHALARAGRPAGPCRPPIHDPRPATVKGLDEILPALLEAEAG